MDLYGVNKVENIVILSVDENLFWDFATDIMALSKEESDKSYEYLRNDIF